jgi:hypothetical protein
MVAYADTAIQRGLKVIIAVPAVRRICRAWWLALLLPVLGNLMNRPQRSGFTVIDRADAGGVGHTLAIGKAGAINAGPLAAHPGAYDPKASRLARDRTMTAGNGGSPASDPDLRARQRPGHSTARPSVRVDSWSDDDEAAPTLAIDAMSTARARRAGGGVAHTAGYAILPPWWPARSVDVVTFEFENVASAGWRWLPSPSGRRPAFSMLPSSDCAKKAS